MHEVFQPIWLYLKENSVGDLNAFQFFLFLKNNNLSFFKNSSQVHDEDLFRFLFLELENRVKDVHVDKNLDSKDLLLDIFMQIIDYYAPVQKQIKNLYDEILKSPALLKECYFYGKRISGYLFLKCRIEKMVIPSKVIPFSDKLNMSSETDIPAFFHEPAFSALCLYFLYTFQNDDSHDFEKTMVCIAQAVHYIQLKSHA